MCYNGYVAHRQAKRDPHSSRREYVRERMSDKEESARHKQEHWEAEEPSEAGGRESENMRTRQGDVFDAATAV